MKPIQHSRVEEPTLRSLSVRVGRKAVSVSSDSSIVSALRVMSENGGEAVAVTEGGRVVGTFSARDHVRNSLNANGGANAVAGAMSRWDGGFDPGLPLRQCLALMAEKGVHHVVVVHEGGALSLLSGEEIRDEVLRFDERVFHEMDLDWKMLFWRGVYSC